MKNINDIALFIKSFEDSNQDFIIKTNYYHWNAWSILRKSVYFHIKNNLLTPSKLNGNQKRKKFHPKYFINFIISLIKIGLFHPNKNLYISQSKYLTKISPSQKENLFFDEFYTREPNKTIFSTLDTTEIPSNLKNVPSIQLNLFLKILFRLYPKNRLKKERLIANQISNKINAHALNNNINLKIDTKTIIQLLINYRLGFFYYKFIFLIVKPKKIFTIDKIGSPILAAADALQIKVYELQHGFFHKIKPDYYFPNYLKAVKNKIPLPYKILTFGDFFKKEILYNNFWNKNEIVTLGNKKLLNSKSNEIIKNKKTALLILQPSCSEQWIKIIKNLVKNDCNGYLFILKPHPNENQTMIEWYKNIANEHPSEFHFEDKKKNIIDLINEVPVVVGFHSTSLFEALALNKIVISFNLKTKLSLNDLVNQDLNNYIYYVNTSNELLEYLNRIDNFSKNKCDNNIFASRNFHSSVTYILNE